MAQPLSSEPASESAKSTHKQPNQLISKQPSQHAKRIHVAYSHRQVGNRYTSHLKGRRFYHGDRQKWGRRIQHQTNIYVVMLLISVLYSRPAKRRKLLKHFVASTLGLFCCPTTTYFVASPLGLFCCPTIRYFEPCDLRSIVSYSFDTSLVITWR